MSASRQGISKLPKRLEGRLEARARVGQPAAGRGDRCLDQGEVPGAATPVLAVAEDLAATHTVGLGVLRSALLREHERQLQAVVQLVAGIALLGSLDGAIRERLDGSVEVAAVVANASQHLGDHADLRPDPALLPAMELGLELGLRGVPGLEIERLLDVPEVTQVPSLLCRAASSSPMIAWAVARQDAIIARWAGACAAYPISSSRSIAVAGWDPDPSRSSSFRSWLRSRR